MFKNTLAYCGNSPPSAVFLLLTEHKHCVNAATNSNSENASVGKLRVSVGTGTKEDESRSGRIWAAGFHHVTARSRLARVFKLMNRLFLQISIFFYRAAANRGYVGPPIYYILQNTTLVNFEISDHKDSCKHFLLNFCDSPIMANVITRKT
jgi:hypothetical protein